MTRKLPWKTGPAAKASAGLSSSRPGLASAPTRRPLKAEAADSNTENIATRSPIAAKDKVTRPSNRAASTSPPPEPLEERFMREGVDEDDMYRMVEDEFTSTAQRFTAHLHAVEYQKLKDAAKTQNAQTIKSISRPVVGSMSDLVQKKQARAARLKKQRTATNGNMSDDDTDDDAYHQGTSLFGLMASPRKKVPRLPVDHTIPLPGSKRAAVGFQRGTHTSGRPMQASSGPTSGSSIKMATHHAINLDRHDEDDDLDAPSRRPPAISSTSSAGATAPRPMKSLGKTAQPNIPQKRRHGPPPKSQSRPQPHSAAQGTHEDQGQSSNDDSNGALFGFQKRTQQLNNRSRRKDGVTAKSKGADHQKSEQDFIPGFL